MKPFTRIFQSLLSIVILSSLNACKFGLPSMNPSSPDPDLEAQEGQEGGDRRDEETSEESVVLGDFSEAKIFSAEISMLVELKTNKWVFVEARSDNSNRLHSIEGIFDSEERIKEIKGSHYNGTIGVLGEKGSVARVSYTGEAKLLLPNIPRNPVVKIFYNKSGLFGLQQNGSIIHFTGEEYPLYEGLPVVDIVQNRHSLLVLRENGRAEQIAHERFEKLDLNVEGKKIVKIYSNRTEANKPFSANGFAVLRDDGSVFSWDPSDEDHETPEVLTTGEIKVSEIFEGIKSFSALSDDGEVYNWGRVSIQGKVENNSAPIDKIVSGNWFCTVGLQSDAQYVRWGNGGDQCEDQAIERNSFNYDPQPVKQHLDSYQRMVVWYEDGTFDRNTFYRYSYRYYRDQADLPRFKAKSLKMADHMILAILEDGTFFADGTSMGRPRTEAHGERFKDALGGKQIADIGVAYNLGAALTKQGELVVWNQSYNSEDYYLFTTQLSSK